MQLGEKYNSFPCIYSETVAFISKYSLLNCDMICTNGLGMRTRSNDWLEKYNDV